HSVNDVIDELARKFQNEVNRLPFPLRGTGPPDESWYWAAPMLLDYLNYRRETEAWWQHASLASAWAGAAADPEGIWPLHVSQAFELIDSVRSGERLMGPPPEDLLEVLAITACSGPAITLLRALTRAESRRAGRSALDTRFAAARASRAFLSLFNQP